MLCTPADQVIPLSGKRGASYTRDWEEREVPRVTPSQRVFQTGFTWVTKRMSGRVE
jgi:hypothetical protein